MTPQWEHLTIIISKSQGAIQSIGKAHGESLAQAQAEGWEAVGVTTLVGGAVLFLFKRPAGLPPSEITQRMDVEIGFVRNA